MRVRLWLLQLNVGFKNRSTMIDRDCGNQWDKRGWAKRAAKRGPEERRKKRVSGALPAPTMGEEGQRELGKHRMEMKTKI